MISAPSNFNHISHMGPGDGIQIQRLMDLPTTLETADSTASISNPIISSPLQAQQPGNTQQRVKSMISQSPASSTNSGKLPSRLPSASSIHHPQRSISHNEVRILTKKVIKATKPLHYYCMWFASLTCTHFSRPEWGHTSMAAVALPRPRPHPLCRAGRVQVKFWARSARRRPPFQGHRRVICRPWWTSAAARDLLKVLWAPMGLTRKSTSISTKTPITLHCLWVNH